MMVAPHAVRSHASQHLDKVIPVTSLFLDSSQKPERKSRGTRRAVCDLAALPLTVAVVGIALWCGAPARVKAQDSVSADVGAEALVDDSVLVDNGVQQSDPSVAQSIAVDRKTSDPSIADRLKDIYQATGWFDTIEVDVNGGVVFLQGVVDSQAHRTWAEATAMNTVDVVAVVNRLSVRGPSVWNFAPAIESMQQLGRDIMFLLPLLIIATVIVIVAIFVARVAGGIAQHASRRRVPSPLLRQVIGNVTMTLIAIVGVYIALRVSGLTRLAVTLLGGTGLVGLALGFAFRDIAENYLASILISLNHPFRVGDLIEVDGSKGFVRKVTTRGTVLNTLEGNQIQIPNSTVFKSKILNFTATPLLRLQFNVGIGFDDPVATAQAILMETLVKHPAVNNDPPPLVLVDTLGSATVNLQCLYWIDQTRHSPLKVGSSVIRLAKDALVVGGVSMPDEAREVIFPNGVPIRKLDSHQAQSKTEQRIESTDAVRPPVEAPERSAGEGDFSNEQSEVMRVTDDDETIRNEVNLIE